MQKPILINQGFRQVSQLNWIIYKITSHEAKGKVAQPTQQKIREHLEQAQFKHIYETQHLQEHEQILEPNFTNSNVINWVVQTSIKQVPRFILIIIIMIIMQSLFFKSLKRSRKFTKVLKKSKIFQRLLDYSRKFYRIPENSRKFQIILLYSRKVSNVLRSSR